MTPFVDPEIVKDAEEKDLERVIIKGERVLEVCTNPKCFEDTCKGECEYSEDE
jgi:hypothetical protein